MGKKEIYYTITCDIERNNVEDCFKTKKAAEEFWKHLCKEDKKNMPNAQIEKNIDTYDNEDWLIQCDVEVVEHLY